jgi:hypothetical protein
MELTLIVILTCEKDFHMVRFIALIISVSTKIIQPHLGTNKLALPIKQDKSTLHILTNLK